MTYLVEVSLEGSHGVLNLIHVDETFDALDVFAILEIESIV